LKEVKLIQNLNNHELYFPEKENFWDKIKNSYNNYIPQNPYEIASAIIFPSGYYLNKMPLPVHRRFNKILKYSTKILAEYGAEEPALAVGIAYGLSSIIYGIKSKSGKHTTAGIFHILNHLEKHPNKKLSVFAKNSKKIFEKHFRKK